MSTTIKDKDWIKQSFLLPDVAGSMKDDDRRRRVATSAAFKFTDTTLGGNFSINAPPQFTRFADIKRGGNGTLPFASSYKSTTSPSRGMGRMYAEAIDDNGQHVTMSFGVPTFNSLTSFFGSFYDPQASALARTGRGESIFHTVGKVAGFVLAVPFMPFIAGSKIIKNLLNIKATKYYYLKNTMPLYWNAVNAMANTIAVNMGIVPRLFSPSQSAVYDPQLEASTKDIKAYSDAMAKMYPDMFREAGGIDVYAISTRAQRLADRYNETYMNLMKDYADADDIRQRIREFQYNPSVDGPSTPASLDLLLSAYANSDNAKAATQPTTTNTSTTGTDTEQSVDKDSSFVSYWKGFAEYVAGERHDGSGYVTFRVDYSGPASESFQSSTMESQIAQKINSMSSQARTTRFDFADGNINDGFVGQALGLAIDAAKNVAMGVADGLQISGLAALAGSAFVDIPKMWESSSAKLPSADFTIELRSPYGNKLSRFQNLYIPLCMLLAGALPLSTGTHSYTSPFLCELFCKGRTQIRLGIIDSLSVTRGTGNLGWTADGEPLGIDVSFSVMDLSSVIHMPIVTSLSWAAKGLLGAGAAIDAATGGSTSAENWASFVVGDSYTDDSLYNDYMAILGSLSFTDQVYAFRRLGLNAAKTKLAFDSWRSPSHLASWFNGILPGRILNAISDGTNRP